MRAGIDPFARLNACCPSTELIVSSQLSVAGFDDSQIAEIVWPALTTIHQPTADRAGVATGLLNDLLRGTEARPVTELAYTFDERGSTAPAP